MAPAIALAVHINATPDTIFAALTESQGLASFWTSDSQAEAVIGSISQFGFPTGSRLEVRVEALEPNRRVVWALMNGTLKGPHWTGTTVRWDLRMTEIGSTEVLFQQTQWPEDLRQVELAGVTYTWAQIIRALKGYTETGTPQPVFAMTALR